jgi:energy-converting hydrogenase Eha subunit E
VILTLRTISAIQGFYYAATGLWPLVSMDTFVAVSGPKTDLWLVRTVSLLIICIGAALLLSAKMNRVTAPVAFLAVSAAASLGWVDANYSLRGIIWPVYMMDAFAEALLIVGWTTAYLLSRRGPR